MIIPSSTHGVIASSRPRVVVASSIVTPTPALNWTGTLGNDSESACADYTEERVLGITETITLSFTVISSGGTIPAVNYRKASTALSSAASYCGSSNSFGGTPTPEGTSTGFLWSALHNGTSLLVTTLNVSAGDYIAFQGFGQAPPFPPPIPGENFITIRINNQTDGNAVIDTITFSQQA